MLRYKWSIKPFIIKYLSWKWDWRGGGERKCGMQRIMDHIRTDTLAEFTNKNPFELNLFMYNKQITRYTRMFYRYMWHLFFSYHYTRALRAQLASIILISLHAYFKDEKRNLYRVKWHIYHENVWERSAGCNFSHKPLYWDYKLSKLCREKTFFI
jgi:hypothetical protein